MRLGQAATVGLMLCLAAAFAACGEESTPGAGRASAAPGRAGQALRPPADAPCRDQLRPVLGPTSALRKDLAAGLSYGGYLDELRRVRTAYGRIRADRLPIGCLLATAGPAERALNRYIDAANAWGECLATAACEIDAIEPRLQRIWARASDLLSSAQSGL